MEPIYIYPGNCTVFGDCTKWLTFHLETDLDLTGWTAEFKLFSITRKITDITSKSFDVILSHKETKELLPGKALGSITLTDNRGNVKTIVNNIPFEITYKVIENEYQEIDLTIPQSSGVDIKLRVGMQGGGGAVDSVNGMTGDVVLEIPSLVSQLQNDEGFVTSLEVMQAIASIPQFKLSIVEELPLAGEKMTLYLIPKEGTDNDVYNEYIWIEQTSSFEFLGTTAVDLTDYVKKTDIATETNAGVIKVSQNFGVRVSGGFLGASIDSLDIYNARGDSSFIGKGTLENVLSQYYTKGEIDSKIGNINQMLDVINGEVI